MVDRRVPGRIPVTPVVVEAAKTLARLRGAEGAEVPGAVQALSEAKVDWDSEDADRSHALAQVSSPVSHLGYEEVQRQVAAAERTALVAMEAIANLERARQELGKDDPELEARLAEIQQAATDSISQVADLSGGIGI